MGAIHPKAMPVILMATEDIEIWLTAPAEVALKLQRPLPDGALLIVARGEKKDGSVSQGLLTVWAATVAEALGHPEDIALTLASAL